MGSVLAHQPAPGGTETCPEPPRQSAQPFPDPCQKHHKEEPQAAAAVRQARHRLIAWWRRDCPGMGSCGFAAVSRHPAQFINLSSQLPDRLLRCSSPTLRPCQRDRGVHLPISAHAMQARQLCLKANHQRLHRCGTALRPLRTGGERSHVAAAGATARRNRGALAWRWRWDPSARLQNVRLLELHGGVKALACSGHACVECLLANAKMRSHSPPFMSSRASGSVFSEISRARRK